MAFNIASAGTSATLLSSSILLLLFVSCSSTSLTNVLKSGEKLASGESLSTGSYKFVMQSDCNLVLYDNGEAIWASNTVEMGTQCRLQLQSNGELIIFAGLGKMIWRSETGGGYGKYALVLHSNGNVVVYESPTWSIGALVQSQISHGLSNSTEPDSKNP
ncbi:mannose-specific lectin-like [Phalaenopsis equestris]|uniref:mannose-specific lectin-like n=1 Tax=Phalaenopsis equestris TaxID=78828 RepID=UPI0009E3DAD9|nr:mannose-specific lectin-like [Phalaenopsis equestris]